MRFQTACLVGVVSLSAACGSDGEKRRPFDTSSFQDAVEMTPADGVPQATLSGLYRDDLANHRGCTPRPAYDGTTQTEPLVRNVTNDATRPASTPANIPGYTCAANEWTQPNEDTSKPIVILVHGNSSGVGSWEEYVSNTKKGTSINLPTAGAGGGSFVADSTARAQLASKLIAQGYRVYGFDARSDLILNPNDPQNSGNTPSNFDHGWTVPMLQSMIRAVMVANPTRKVSLVGHSLGVTEIRDALRRLFVAYGKDPENNPNPFAQVKDLVYLSGANHGVAAGGTICVNPVPESNSIQMRLYVNCELGDRDAFQPTYFSVPITGANDAFTTPCADGNTAFGQADACDGNTVEFTTIVMEDKPGGTLQDEFVSEASAALNSGQPIDNHTIGLGDYDTSAYFAETIEGFLANHFGSARSTVGTDYIVQKLGD